MAELDPAAVKSMIEENGLNEVTLKVRGVLPWFESRGIIARVATKSFVAYQHKNFLSISVQGSVACRYVLYLVQGSPS